MVTAGVRAPGFRLARLGGGTVSLADVVDKAPAIIAFFKISCPVCQLMFPHLDRLHAAGKLPIFGISQNDAASSSEFNRNFGITLPILLDPENDFPASNAYGITHVPALFLIERDGTVAQVINGWSRLDMQALGELAGADPFLPGQRVPEFQAG